MSLRFASGTAWLVLAVLLAGCGDALVGGRCLPGYLAAPGDGGCIRLDRMDGGVRDVTSDSAVDAHSDGAVDATGDSALDGGGDGTAPDGRDGTALDAPDLGLDGDQPDSPANEGGNPVDSGDDSVDVEAAALDVALDVPGDTTASSDVISEPSQDVAAGDSASPGCDAGLAVCSGVCVDMTSDANHCGSCTTVCTGTDRCVLGVCVPRCAPPTVVCGGLCVDPQTDEFNCGSCGVVCVSGLCNAGSCRDSRGGHVVLIGHSFARSRPDQDRLIGNAVFLATTTVPRVLVYEGAADPAAIVNVDMAITSVAGARTWVRTVVTDATTLSSTLSIDRFDVMLILEQSTATDAAISSLAVNAGAAMANFARAGGVVIVVDGPQHNGGTYPVMAATMLLNPTAIRNVDNAIVVRNPAAATDAVAVGVRASYRAAVTSVAFTSADPYAVYLQGTDPVVLHRAVGP